MTPENNKEALIKETEILAELAYRRKYNYIEFVFPNTGKYSRAHYAKHVEFMNAGAHYHDRLFSAANQVGKTTAILTEGYYHLSLDYPDRFEGKKFVQDTIIIFGAKTWAHLKDGIQAKLLGETELGTGLIPKNRILKTVTSPNVTGGYAQVWVRNNRGGISKALFKTYDAGQEAWESMTVDAVFFDEEPPLKIYIEGSIRTMRKNGVVAIGFTPDSGMTDTVGYFFTDGDFLKGGDKSKFIAMVGWNDVPHLSEEAKAAMRAKIPPYLLQAKSEGIPYLGMGRIFPMDLNEVEVTPFPIPDYFERFYGFDPGNTCAAIFCARDPDTDTIYVIDEYGSSDQPLQVVAEAINKRALGWIEGVCDPYYSVQKRALNTTDVKRIIDIYRDLGLKLYLADRNTKESGIEVGRIGLLRGKIKFFNTCTRFKLQLSLYHRDEHNNTGKTPCDFVDAWRYAITYGINYAKSKISYINEGFDTPPIFNIGKRDSITGY